MNTEFIQRGGTTVKKHGGKLVHGLNAAAIVFLYTYFVPKDQYIEHCRICGGHVSQTEFERERQASKDSHAALWRRSADFDLKFDRLTMRSPHDVSTGGTNIVESGSN